MGMKVSVDSARCQGHGMCEEVAATFSPSMRTDTARLVLASRCRQAVRTTSVEASNRAPNRRCRCKRIDERNQAPC